MRFIFFNMAIGKLPFIALTCLLGALASAQGSPPRCLNTLAFYNPSLRTMCYNASQYFPLGLEH